MSRRKSTTRAKLKAASQEEWIHLWKKYFKNLFGKFPKVTYELISKIINNQQDIKLGQFAQELDIVLRKIKNRMDVCLSRIMENKEILRHTALIL